MKVFITGANGFVGKALITTLKAKQIDFTAGERSLYGDFCEQKNWNELLAGHDVVVHLAARVHVMEEVTSDPLSEFRKMNVEATVSLARAARDSGVKRFIFVSSVKVNGEETQDAPFRETDPAAPLDPYGISKMEAETELLKLHQSGAFEVVIIRPPLIYGPGVKANFEKLFWLVKKDLPLPFGAVKNKRSLVSVFNLCDLVITCFTHPKASGQIFLVSDQKDYSLKDLIQLIGKVEGKHPHLLYVPVGIMSFAARILGKSGYAQRLFGNLHVDTTKSQQLLGWNPPYDFEQTFSAEYRPSK